MGEIYKKNYAEHKPWKKAVCVILSVILAFGTLVTITVSSSRLQDWLGMKSMLSAYASEIVDTKDAVAVNKEAMLSDSTLIDLENKDGSNTVYLFSEPISYTDEKGNLKTKDISVEKQSDKELKSKGYEYTNGQNDYRINFSEDIEKGVMVEFGGCEYTIVPQTPFKSVVGEEKVSTVQRDVFETFEYNGAFGTQTNLKFYPQLNGVKDEIVLDSNIGQNVFSFRLVTNNCTAVLNEDGTVSLVSNDNKENVQTFSAPFAYDSEYVEGDLNEHYIDCKYSLETVDDNTYIMSVNTDKSWLESESTVYPVTIDPVTSNISNSKDAGVYRKYPNNNYGNEQLCCFGYSKDYEKGRVYSQFTLPGEIKKGATINSAYQWERETTGRTTSTKVIAYLVKDSWTETGVVWSALPTYNKNFASNKRTISSKSTDKESSPYWYKFNIKSIVNEWINGSSKNNGILFRSDEEDELNYNWRAFASRTYSTSSYRPYTVINYTNDTTAPTYESISGNPTEWTNKDVTLKINGSKDTGAGLHATPYSFSTTKGEYHWQSGAEKTYSSNCTVYISVRDALGNKTAEKAVNITKIDKLNPSKVTITGNASDWINKDIVLTAKSTDAAATSSNGKSDIAYYSFSVAEGTYVWQTESTKTISANGTYFVYAKDKAGNISPAEKIAVTYLDKNAPSKPVVTGNSEGWTNGDIELTAQSTDSGSGVCAYSFSESKDKYNWQSQNTYTADKNSKIYISAKDNAGNISSTEVLDLKIDKISPTGTIKKEEPEDWVKQVVITANADDELSGLNETPYSFGTKKDEYNWQAENTKTITRNGTYYVYVRDSAGNITLIDTVTVDKVDSTAPTINSIDKEVYGNETKLTVSAVDTQSGIELYSFDNGITWQESNEFTFETDAYNYMYVKVKDRLGNVSSQRYDFYTPQIYKENGKIILYNPNPKCESEIYYRLSNKLFPSETYKKYTDPISTDNEEIYVTFVKPSFATTITGFLTLQIPENQNTIGRYEEANTDLSFSYRNVSFDFSRTYDNENNKWFFSLNSHLEFDNDKNVITAVLPNGQKTAFLPKAVDVYYNIFNHYELHISRNSDNSVNLYTVIINDLYYNYNADGVLVSVSDKYDDNITISRSGSEIKVTDDAGRTYVAKLNIRGDIASIIDLAGEEVTYSYNISGNLTKVEDQSGVITNEYEYNNGLISRSNDKSVTYDSQNRVTQLLYDNGAFVTYEYTDNSVSISSSDERTQSITYDKYGNVLLSKDEYDDVTTYKYDSCNRLIEVAKNDKTVNTYSYSGDMLNFVTNGDNSSVYYYYYDDGKLFSVNNYTEKDNTYTYYQYDEFGNVSLTAQGNKYLTLNNIDFTNEADFESLVKYTYENGLITKTEDIISNTITVSQYDIYGNTVRTETTQTDDGQTTVSISESTYDVSGRLVLSKSDNSEIEYFYDKAGRVLLSKADGKYQRTVYDSEGRTVQEIDDTDYNPDIDDLSAEYPDKTVGHRYEYDSVGNLVKETNRLNLVTTYEYSTVGSLSKKHFDIYDYYYQNNGKCDKIDVNEKTIVDYEYKVAESVTGEGETRIRNRITYADGYVEEELTDKYGNVIKKYANGEEYYSYGTTDRIIYTDKENSQYDMLFTKDDESTYTQYNSAMHEFFSYSTKTVDDKATVTQEHFSGKAYKMSSGENAIDYTTPTLSFSYTTNGEDDTATSKIVKDAQDILSANINYDEDKDKLSKSYNIEDFSFTTSYDEDGNVVSDEHNSYTYDNLGELIKTSGAVNSSYTYDSRGNMLSKTVNGENTTFEYANALWQDQLTKVNGKALTYDANGNLQSYDGAEYTWSHGKRLSSITNGDTKYEYQYDLNGIRSYKTVNGVTTKFDTLNGKILAQSDKNNKILFQYNGDTPIGFELNSTQYFYLTNLSGDVVGITDVDGNLIAKYSYDEWGKLLAIETAEENNAEQQKIAELNPLRYRGYYYDNETGMYYLQSRYYNPELCRFISADSFDYIFNIKFRINAYLYCSNDPINFIDALGNYYYGKEYNLSKGWKGIILKRSNAKKVHAKIYKGDKVYSQDEDGKPTDNSTGTPPGYTKEKFKEQTGWDWDAKEKAYNEKQKKNNNFSLDFGNVGDVIIATLLIVIVIGSGVGIAILIILALLPDPVPFPVPV